tara:strand:+ start:358 stop:558 length:201 start_codon:yes stop_codon:yes gene_type:complete
LALFSTPALVSQELLYVVVNNIAAHLLPAPPKTAIDWHAGIILQLIFLQILFYNRINVVADNKLLL